MVLKEGGPCVGKPRTGKGTCGKVESHVWYAGPMCKACYERRRTAQGSKRPRVGASEAEEEEASGVTPLSVVVLRLQSPVGTRPITLALDLLR